MKEHIFRELVNDLRDIATDFHAHGCLRELIGRRVGLALQEQNEWEKEHPVKKN